MSEAATPCLLRFTLPDAMTWEAAKIKSTVNAETSRAGKS